MAVLTPDQFTRITQLVAQPPVAAPDIRTLNLATENIQPTMDHWVTPDDFLVVGIRNALAGVQVQVACRLWLPDGTFAMPQFTVTPPSDRTLNFTSQQLYYGYLVSATATAVGGTLPARGQTYCTLQLVRPPLSAFLVDQAQASGYITTANFLAWPAGRIQDAIEGPGAVYSIAVATPAAGAEFIQTVPTGARWRPLSVTGSFAGDGTGGNRAPSLQIDDGANPLFIILGANAIAAAQSSVYDWVTGYPVQLSVFWHIVAPFPPGLQMPAGWRISSKTGGLAGGDRWTNVRIFVEEVLED